jgi:hypothetical protein
MRASSGQCGCGACGSLKPVDVPGLLASGFCGSWFLEAPVNRWALTQRLTGRGQSCPSSHATVPTIAVMKFLTQEI